VLSLNQFWSKISATHHSVAAYTSDKQVK